MKVLQYKYDRNIPENYVRDVVRIQDAFEEEGYFVRLQDCYLAWSQYSDNYAAGWLVLPSENSEIVRELLEMFIPV